MKEDRLEAFKQVIRRRIDMRRMVAVCAGDEELARCLVVKGLRDIAGKIERDGGKPRVRWDAKRNISIMNTGPDLGGRPCLWLPWPYRGVFLGAKTGKISRK
jgi:hypothetical protein